jgi:hypothetical protein
MRLLGSSAGQRGQKGRMSKAAGMFACGVVQTLNSLLGITVLTVCETGNFAARKVNC